MTDDREGLARQDARTSAVALAGGLLLFGLGGALWVSSARTSADAVALGQLLALLGAVFFVASVAFGLSSRWWRHGP